MLWVCAIVVTPRLNEVTGPSAGGNGCKCDCSVEVKVLRLWIQRRSIGFHLKRTGSVLSFLQGTAGTVGPHSARFSTLVFALMSSQSEASHLKRK